MYHDSPFFTQRVSRPGVSLLSSLGGLALTRLTLSISRRFFRGLAHTTARINTNARRRLVIVPILRFRSSRASPKKGFDETAAAGWLGPLPSSSFLQQQSFGGRPLAEERITSEPRGEKVCRLAIRRSTTRPNRTHPFGKGSFLVKERALFFFSFSLSPPPSLFFFFFRFSYSSRPVSRFKYSPDDCVLVSIPVEHEREHRRLALSFLLFTRDQIDALLFTGFLRSFHSLSLSASLFVGRFVSSFFAATSRGWGRLFEYTRYAKYAKWRTRVRHLLRAI